MLCSLGKLEFTNVDWIYSRVFPDFLFLLLVTPALGIAGLQRMSLAEMVPVDLLLKGMF